MSLLDTASLIVTPNGVKEGKLYSVIPSDGSGDMSVTRATTATRVNSQGLVELVPYNLFEYSEQFDDAWWTKYESTVTANNTTAPNGTTTADKLTDTTANDGHFFYRVLTISSALTLSVYAKAAEYTKVAIRNLSDGGDVIFDLANGTIISTAGNFANAQIESIGNGWYRISATTNGTSGTKAMGYGLVNNSNQTTFVGTGTSSAYFWGAQLVEGSTAKPYQKTETRLNIPRLDYSNGTCPSLLVEPQRTNFFLRSQEFENASWVKQNTILNANSIISPDGTQNAEKFIASNTTSLHAMFNLTATLSGLYTISIYAKKGEYDYIVLHEQFSGTFFGHFNLNTGVVMSGTGAKIENVGNGWYRCMVSFNALGVFNIPSFSPSNAFGDINYMGDGTSGIYIWGAQLEAGSYATSYIPTTSASVTRNADVISKTGISSLIGQTEGTLFVDVDLRSRINFNYIALNNGGGTSNYISIYFLDNAMGLECVSGSSPQAAIQYNNSSTGIFKIAIAYKNNDFVLYVNGNLIGTDTSGSVPTCDVLDLTAYNRANQIGINVTALWKTRLTNTQLAQLTTI